MAKSCIIRQIRLGDMVVLSIPVHIRCCVTVTLEGLMCQHHIFTDQTGVYMVHTKYTGGLTKSSAAAAACMHAQSSFVAKMV